MLKGNKITLDTSLKAEMQIIIRKANGMLAFIKKIFKYKGKDIYFSNSTEPSFIFLNGHIHISAVS